MLGSTGTLFALIGLAMLSAGGVAYALLFGRISSDNQTDKRIDQIQKRNPVAAAAAKVRVADTNKRRKSIQDTLKEMEDRQKAKAKQSTAPSLALRFQQAGLNWTRRGYYTFSVLAGIVIAAATFFIGLPLYACGIFAAVGFLALPRWVVNFRRKRRIKKFLNEFPNAIDVIVRGIKAGLPLNDCIRIIANEAAEPVKSEFKTISEAQSVGLGMADAVAKLPERVPVPESSFFAIVIMIQSKAGGNLSEALGNLSRVIRERKKMKGKINALSQEAKASGGIIGSLPVIVMGLVYLSSPAYITLLFTDPVGHVILGASAIWMFLGVMVMKQMINFDY